MKALPFVIASVLVVLAGRSLAATTTASKAATPPSELGMVIRGDQEAPLVLYIVPWQESAVTALPDAPLVPLLPTVLDHERSLIHDPAQRSLGTGSKPANQ